MVLRAIHATGVVCLAFALLEGQAIAEPATPLSDAAPTPAPAPASSTPLTQETTHNDGLLGPLRLGALGGVGFPCPFSVEGMLKVDDVVAIGVEYGVLPSISASGVNASLSAVAADLRVFPMRSGFFVGLAVGHQSLDVTGQVTLPASLGSVSEEVTADTWFVTPRVGFLWTLRWGLTVGIDAGAQIPVAASSTNTLPTAFSASQTASSFASLIGKDVLPSVDLLQVGMLL